MTQAAPALARSAAELRRRHRGPRSLAARSSSRSQSDRGPLPSAPLIAVTFGTMAAGTNPELEVGPNRPTRAVSRQSFSCARVIPYLWAVAEPRRRPRITLLDDPQLHFMAEAPPTASLNDHKPIDRCVCIVVHTDVFSPQSLIAQDGRPRTDTSRR